MDLGWVACLKPVIGCPSPVIAYEYHEDRRPLIARQDRSQDAHGMWCMPCIWISTPFSFLPCLGITRPHCRRYLK
jgi:hypothetical protein